MIQQKGLVSSYIMCYNMHELGGWLLYWSFNDIRLSLRKVLWSSLAMRWSLLYGSWVCLFVWIRVSKYTHCACKPYLLLIVNKMLVINQNCWGIAGVVELVSDFVVCEEGKSLSPESAGILVCIMSWLSLSSNMYWIWFDL